jgi:phosphoribosylglycinamide formyltransferase 1
MKANKCKLAIFASGNGSNAEAIIQYFHNKPLIEVKAIFSNNSGAYVLDRARKHNIPEIVFNHKDFNSPEFNNRLLREDYDLLVLAGFMWLVPPTIVSSFSNKIINIHPALLPKYGGKGMYGDFVHKAVIANKEKESGITIHYVNEQYDKGDIIFQEKCPVLSSDTAASLAKKIHLLEYRYYPQVIEKVCHQIC